jgi:hypothetical protein
MFGPMASQHCGRPTPLWVMRPWFDSEAFGKSDFIWLPIGVVGKGWGRVNQRPVPGPGDNINIYDLAIMDDASVRVRVEKTLSKFPALRRIYTSSFLDGLIRDRQNLNNHLLLLLADTEGPFTPAFWSQVSDDLIALEDVGAFKVFRSKLRQRGRIELQSAKTELELPVWMRRKGYPIELEPLNPENRRRCEFAAESIPPTSWESRVFLTSKKSATRTKFLQR